MIEATIKNVWVDREGSNCPVHFELDERKYIAKTVSEKQAENELLGKIVSNAAGLKTPDMKVVSIDSLRKDIAEHIKADIYTKVLIMTEIEDVESIEQSERYDDEGLAGFDNYEKAQLNLSVAKDALIGNADGNLSNYLINRDGEVYAIDNAEAGSNAMYLNEYAEEMLRNAIEDEEIENNEAKIREWVEDYWGEGISKLEKADFTDAIKDEETLKNIQKRQVELREKIVEQTVDFVENEI